jgi:hypothetical protein
MGMEGYVGRGNEEKKWGHQNPWKKKSKNLSCSLCVCFGAMKHQILILNFFASDVYPLLFTPSDIVYLPIIVPSHFARKTQKSDFAVCVCVAECCPTIRTPSPHQMLEQG